MTFHRPFLALMLAGAGALSPALAFAHDFWIDLDRWSTPKDQIVVDAAFLVGHVADQNSWALKPERVSSFVTINPDGAVSDIRSRLHFKEEGRNGGASLDVQGEGVHVIAFESNNAGSELSAEPFNGYLEEEGLDAVKRVRANADRMDEPGRETYSRRAKAIVKLGKGAATLPAPLGQTLEIVPIDNPFALEDGAPLRVRVDYKGAPLPGALVSIESLSVGLLPKSRQTTDAAGVASFAFPRKGAWKLNVVWSEPISSPDPKFPNAEFETIFSSLTFGY